MTQTDPTPTQTPWLALRLSSGLSQREVERRLGWEKRGHLSLIERGIPPSPEQAAQLREFYGRLLTGHSGAATRTDSPTYRSDMRDAGRGGLLR